MTGVFSELAGFRRRDGAVNETLKWEQRGGTLFLRLIDAAPLQDSLVSEHWLIKVIKCNVENDGRSGELVKFERCSDRPARS